MLLDEATAALDYESEAAIMANLNKICEGSTVISIAHRLNTIKNSVRILAVDNGQVTEQGSHSELIMKEGTYAELWRQQTLV